MSLSTGRWIQRMHHNASIFLLKREYPSGGDGGQKVQSIHTAPWMVLFVVVTVMALHMLCRHFDPRGMLTGEEGIMGLQGVPADRDKLSQPFE